MRNRISRTTALLCCLALLLGMVQLVSAYSYDFVDPWAEVEVKAMDELGLVPQALADTDLRLPITRRSMCQIAVLSYERYTGQTLTQPAEHPFTDTTEPAIEKAQAIGLVDGYVDGTFQPDGILTRQEFFCFVGKFLETIHFPLSDDMLGDLSGFTDWQELGPWARDYTGLCVGLDIVRGTGAGLSPRVQTKAEEALLMFYRAYVLATTVDGSLGSTPPDNQGGSSNDIPSNEPGDAFSRDFPNTSDWAKPEIESMNSLGLIPDGIRGTSMAGSITRSNMCKMAVLAYKKLSGQTDLQPNGSSPFTDTNDADIILAAQLGIVNGYSDKTFKPENLMSREEYFVITSNLLKALGYPYQDDTLVNLASEFEDGTTVGDWAKPSARLLVSLEIVKGGSGKLNPKNTIICQEAIALFYRSYTFMASWDPNAADPRPTRTRQAAADLVSYALQFEGYSYIYGGQSPSGFDCSGLVWYVFGKKGYSLNRTASAQYSNGTPISKSELLPGDLVFFTEGYGISHVGIYVGNNTMIHAANSRTGVVLSNLSTGYYYENYYGAVRVIGK